ncbi:MAG: diacylglycerol kinase family protein [Anaerolineales bacterium]|nr:diacylglycerol kinase family protein [Anaerolineales bacterium]
MMDDDKKSPPKRLIHKDIQATLAINPEDYSLQVSANRLASLRYAVAGWLHMLRYQKNTRIQAVASVAVFTVSFWLAIPPHDLAIIILTVAMVWMAEFVNAAVEAAINLASAEFHPMAKVGKDVAAATVLLGVVTSIVIGLLILGPPLWERLT